MTPGQISALRHRLGLSADKFADKRGFLGKNRGLTVYRWESGKRVPSPQTVLLMKQLASDTKHIDAASR
jgi:DNA-binding transcriptional regulator YiaG